MTFSFIFMIERISICVEIKVQRGFMRYTYNYHNG